MMTCGGWYVVTVGIYLVDAAADGIVDGFRGEGRRVCIVCDGVLAGQGNIVLWGKAGIIDIADRDGCIPKRVCDEGNVGVDVHVDEVDGGDMVIAAE